MVYATTATQKVEQLQFYKAFDKTFGDVSFVG